jgi:hypothetical protein
LAVQQYFAAVGFGDRPAPANRREQLFEMVDCLPILCLPNLQLHLIGYGEVDKSG